MKKLFWLLLFIICLSIESSAFAAKPGDTVTIEVKVISNSAAMTAKVGLNYDHQALEFLSATSSNGWTAPQNSEGSFGIANADQLIPTASIGTVSFHVRENASNGEYTITPVVQKAVDTNYQSVTMSVWAESIMVEGAKDDTTSGTVQAPSTSPSPTSNSSHSNDETSMSPQTASGSFISSGYPAKATTTLKKVIVRLKPDASGKKVTRIDKSNTSVTVIGETQDKKGETWYQVELSDGKTGYIKGNLLKVERTVQSSTGSGVGSTSSSKSAELPNKQGGFPFTAVTNIKRVNVRKQPGMDADGITQLEYPGTTVQVTGSAYDKEGTLWYTVTVEDGKSGYIRSDLLQRVAAGSANAQSLTLPSLIFKGFTLHEDQKLDVYSAPSKNAWRGADGRACVAGNEKIFVAGYEADWLLIMYEVSSGGYRIGYIDTKDMHGSIPDISNLNLTRQQITLNSETQLTDDPYAQMRYIGKVNTGKSLTVLAKYTSGSKEWAYVETMMEGKVTRGFLPL